MNLVFKKTSKVFFPFSALKTETIDQIENKLQILLTILNLG